MDRKDALIDIAYYARQIGLPHTSSRLLRLSEVDDSFDIEDRSDLAQALSCIKSEVGTVSSSYSNEFRFLESLI